jgi:hypothetical protein
LGSRLVHGLGFSLKGSKNPTTQTSTLKFMDEVVVEVMYVDKTIELF